MSCEADKTDVDGSKAFLSPPSHKSKYIGGVGGVMLSVETVTLNSVLQGHTKSI